MGLRAQRPSGYWPGGWRGGVGLASLLGMASSGEPAAGPRAMWKGQAERSPTGKEADRVSRGWEYRQQVERGSSVKARSKEGRWYCPDLWTEGQRGCVCVSMCPQVCRVGTWPRRRHGDREACLHRGEERVLVGLAAHGPPSVGCRSGRGGAPHTLLPKPCCSTQDPRGTSGKSGGPQGGGGRQAGRGRRAAG